MLNRLIIKFISFFTLSTFIFFTGPLLAALFIYIFINYSTESETKSNQIEKFITEKLIISPKKIDLLPFLPGSWNQVCFLGPYTSGDRTRKILGFKWNSDSLTDISINDGKTILVFITNKQVSYFDSISRDQIDFSVFAGQCINRESAIFLKVSDSLKSKKWVIQDLSKT